MTMLSFRVEEKQIEEVRDWAERLGVDRSELLREALLAPAPITLQWDDSCFWDARMLLDLLKNGLQAGPISQESYLRLTLGNPALEREAKARDSALPDEILHPAFDASHGAGPRLGTKAGPGKPAGKKDNS